MWPQGLPSSPTLRGTGSWSSVNPLLINWELVAWGCLGTVSAGVSGQTDWKSKPSLLSPSAAYTSLPLKEETPNKKEPYEER